MAASRAARQSGMTLISLVSIVVIVGLVALFFMKITPVWIEYFGIKKAIKSMADSGNLKGSIRRSVRRSTSVLRSVTSPSLAARISKYPRLVTAIALPSATVRKSRSSAT